MNTTWPEALKWVRLDEGGNSDDPDDSGGRTSRGITQKEFTAYCHLHDIVAPADVWKAPDNIVNEIYHDEYWLPYCDDLPVGVDYLFFDLNVNAGLARAVKTLQTALNVSADGHFGPVTKLAVRNANPSDLAKRFSAAKKAFYTHLAEELPKDRKFLKGWLNRVNNVEHRTLALIANGGTANV